MFKNLSVQQSSYTILIRIKQFKIACNTIKIQITVQPNLGDGNLEHIIEQPINLTCEFENKSLLENFNIF